MEITIEAAIAVLERTPATLRAMLVGLPDELITSNEGGDSWSPYDVVGHLVSLDRVEWIQRIQVILEHGTSKPFDPVNQIAMFEESKGKTLEQLLDEFDEIRLSNINALKAMALTPEDFSRNGTHPALGEVDLGNLLATWVVHDLNHTHQITQTIARQYTGAVGKFREYLNVL